MSGGTVESRQNFGGGGKLLSFPRAGVLVKKTTINFGRDSLGIS
jgi:hypothetical protein